MATPAHRKLSSYPAWRDRHRSAAIAAVVGVVAVLAVGVGATAYATGHSGAHGAAAGTSNQGGGGAGGATTTTTPVVPLSVVSISPATAATNVASNTPITIHFSHPLRPGTARPVLTPAVAGRWTVTGSTMTFIPQGGYVPFNQVHVSVPASTAATVDKKTLRMASPYQASFTAAPGSTARLEQMLGELDYLPLSFIGAAAAPVANAGPNPAPVAPPTAASTLAAEPSAADAVAVLPKPGTMVWRFPNIPSTLSALWTPGTFNTIDQGAVMAFENSRGMKMDGEPGPAVWAALVNAVADRQIETRPYDYLVANEGSPESLTVWRDGAVVYTSAANTGVAGAATAQGTWPVYDRYVSTTMTGTNPDGSHYSDPNIPWVSYFHGSDAVHGFVRGSYGYPQSDGCVELPPSNAAVVYPMDPYGTLVTVD